LSDEAFRKERCNLLEGIDLAIGILANNSVGDDEGLAFIGSSEAIHGETGEYGLADM
jgi:hypothetical protein